MHRNPNRCIDFFIPIIKRNLQMCKFISTLQHDTQSVRRYEDSDIFIMDLSYVWAGNSYVNNRCLNCYIQFHIIHLSRMNSPHTLFRIKNSSSQTERNVKQISISVPIVFAILDIFFEEFPGLIQGNY